MFHMCSNAPIMLFYTLHLHALLFHLSQLALLVVQLIREPFHSHVSILVTQEGKPKKSTWL